MNWFVWCCYTSHLQFLSYFSTHLESQILRLDCSKFFKTTVAFHQQGIRFGFGVACILVTYMVTSLRPSPKTTDPILDPLSWRDGSSGCDLQAWERALNRGNVSWSVELLALKMSCTHLFWEIFKRKMSRILVGYGIYNKIRKEHSATEVSPLQQMYS